MGIRLNKINALHLVLLLGGMVFNYNCSSKEPNCIINKHGMNYYLDSIDLYHNFETKFANIAIYPCTRGGHYIVAEVNSNNEREVYKFYNFYPDKPNLLRFLVMPPSDGKLCKRITGHDLYSKGFLDFWYERFLWMESHDILSLGSTKSYYFITPNVESDSTYQALKSAYRDYLDLGYERHENKLKNCGCDIKYRFWLVMKKKNYDAYHYNRALDYQRRRSTIYSIGDTAIFFRDLGYSGYCNLDFYSPYCECE